jgi:hypothetical protein
MLLPGDNGTTIRHNTHPETNTLRSNKTQLTNNKGHAINNEYNASTINIIAINYNSYKVSILYSKY